MELGDVQLGVVTAVLYDLACSSKVIAVEDIH